MKLALDILLGLPIRSMTKINRDGESDFVIYPYVNGRERGLCLIDNRENKLTSKKYMPLDEKKTIVFSENRSSDGLIYFIGKAKDFNIWENGDKCEPKTEKFWRENRKMFESDQVKQGIKMIKKEFKL
jgi:hypothetical protein